MAEQEPMHNLHMPEDEAPLLIHDSYTSRLATLLAGEPPQQMVDPELFPPPPPIETALLQEGLRELRRLARLTHLWEPPSG